MKKTTSKTVCANPEAWRLGFGEGRSRDIMLPSHKSEMQSSKPLYRQQDPGVIELGDCSKREVVHLVDLAGRVAELLT